MDNLDQTKRELMDEVKGKLIEELNLEEITPEDIDNEAPLFGDEGLGLDSIDALEIILILEREYKSSTRYVHWQTTSLLIAKLNR